MEKRLVGLIAVWSAALCIGIGATTRYDFTPGEAATPPSRWPSHSTLAQPSKAMALVVFLHPRCVCSEATVTQLEEVVAWAGGRFTTQVVSVEPENSDGEWEHSDILQRARVIPRVEVVRDRGGAEARTFAAATSGFAVLYGEDGKLLFSGGMTGGRGVEGDNPGFDALKAAAATALPSATQSPVFGCGLMDSEPGAGRNRPWL